MTLSRTLVLPLLLTAAFGLSACGSDDKSGSGSSTKEPTTATSIPDQADQLKALIAADQKKIQQIGKDIKSGKLTAKDGAQQIKDLAAEVEAATKNLVSAAGDAAQTSVDEAKAKVDAAKSQVDDAKSSLDDAKSKIEDATK